MSQQLFFRIVLANILIVSAQLLQGNFVDFSFLIGRSVWLICERIFKKGKGESDTWKEKRSWQV